jgi:hypothetical protein
MHIASILALACLGAVVVFAQAPGVSPPDLQGVNALPIPGSPFSLEAAGVGESKLADGRIVTWASEGKMYRDSAGRTRSEWTPPTVGDVPLDSAPMASITDPVAGFLFILIAPSQIAYRAPHPKSDPSFRPSFGFSSGLIRETGKKAVEREALGKQTIEGVEFEGFRDTTTMVDEPSKVAVDEYWISQDMGLIGAALRSNPGGKTTVKIKSLLRQEPDPALFAVPPDYRIEDIAIPGPPK